MIKIGDFSKMAKVSIRMLRHYDQMNLLKPAFIDPSSGYRSYQMDQLPRLSRILFLKDLGFSLAEIKSLIDVPMSLEQMKDMYHKRQEELLQEIEAARYTLFNIRSRLDMIESEGKLPPFDIIVKETEGLSIVSVRGIVPSLLEMDHYCYTMYHSLYESISDIGLTTFGNEMTFYHLEEYAETNLDMEASLTLSGDWKKTLSDKTLPPHLTIRTLPPEPTVASLIYEGPYEGIETGFIELLKWLSINGWEPSGPGREIHLSGRAHGEENPGPPIAELQIPIKKVTQ